MMHITQRLKREPASWEHFPHAADIGIRGYGKTLEAALEQAAYAMTAAVTDPETVKPIHRIELVVNGVDPEQLLYDWLNALVFEMATRRMLFSRFEIFMDRNSLHGAAWGEPVDVRRHEPAAEIKGATYTALKVYCDRTGRWIAQCVVDV